MEAEKNEFEVVEYIIKRLTNTLSSFIPTALMPKEKCKLIFLTDKVLNVTHDFLI